MMISVSIVSPAVGEMEVWRLPLTVYVGVGHGGVFLASWRGERWASESQADVLFLRTIKISTLCFERAGHSCKMQVNSQSKSYITIYALLSCSTSLCVGAPPSTSCFCEYRSTYLYHSSHAKIWVSRLSAGSRIQAQSASTSQRSWLRGSLNGTFDDSAYAHI